MSVSRTHADTRLWKEPAWRRQVGNRQKTNTPWRSSLKKIRHACFASDSLFMTGDLNQRNTGEPPMPVAPVEWIGGGARGEWGQKLRTKDQKKPQNVKLWNWGKGWEKCSLWFALVCLLSAVWAAFVQWPMQLEWRLLSKSSCRAPDKRIKNYDIF